MTTAQLIFVSLSTLMFLWLACIWGSKDVINLTIKIVFFLLTFFGALVLFTPAGALLN